VNDRSEMSVVQDRIERSSSGAAGRVAPAALTHNFIRFYGTWAAGGQCRVRIFEAADRPPVIVCSQISCTSGASICSVAEYLAAFVVGRHCPGRLDEAEPAVWIEHHPVSEDRRRRGAGRLDAMRVTFSSWKPVVLQEGSGWRTRFGEPTWTPVSESELRGLIGDLSAIGE
jgi:hypothetical protein